MEIAASDLRGRMRRPVYWKLRLDAGKPTSATRIAARGCDTDSLWDWPLACGCGGVAFTIASR